MSDRPKLSAERARAMTMSLEERLALAFGRSVLLDTYHCWKRPFCAETGCAWMRRNHVRRYVTTPARQLRAEGFR